MRTFFATTILAISYVHAIGGDITPLGAEFPLSSSNTTVTQGYVWGDCDDDGNFTVGYSVGNIFARRFDRNGTPLGNDVFVNSTVVVGDQNETFLATDPVSGDYLICYSDRNGNDGFNIGAFGRFYKSNGTPYGVEFPLNVNTNQSQFEPHAAFMPNGRVMVVWTDDDPNIDGAAGCIGRIFDRFGNALTGEFLINDPNTKAQIDPTVAASRSGSFVVAYVDSSGKTGEPREILARMFDQSGNPTTAEFLVNSTSTGVQREPTIAMDADGDFVVIWQDESGSDGNGLGVFGRLFDSTGTPKGPQFVVSQTTTGNQQDPHVDMDFVGNFIVTWESDQTGDFDVLLRRFDRDGNPLSGEIPVHSTTAGNQQFAKSIVSQSGQRIVSMWIDDGRAMGRIFEVPTLDVIGNPTLTSTVTITIDLPGMAGEPYFLLPSRGDAPGISINGGRHLDLEVDAMMQMAVFSPNSPPFSQLEGTLDGSGQGQATFTIPDDPSFFGAEVRFAAVTLMNGSINGPQLTTGIQSGIEFLTDPFVVTIGGPPRVLPKQTIAGEIIAPGEEDRATFEAVKGEKIKLIALPIDTLTQGEKLPKFVIEILDPDDQVVGKFKGKIPSAGQKGSKFKLKAKKSGTYTFRIFGKKSTHVGSYRFKVNHSLPKGAKEKTKTLSVDGSGMASTSILAATDATLFIQVTPKKKSPIPASVLLTDPTGSSMDLSGSMTIQGNQLIVTGVSIPATGKYAIQIPGPGGATYDINVNPNQPEDDSVIVLE